MHIYPFHFPTISLLVLYSVMFLL